MAGFFGWLRDRLAPRRAERASDAPLQDFEAYRAEAAKALPFERIETTGGKALETWEALRDAGRGWPVVVGGDRELGILAEGYVEEAERTPEAILAAAAELRMPSALHALRADELEVARAWLAEHDPASLPAAARDGRNETAAAEIGPWPAEPPAPTALTVAYDYQGRPLPKVHILLIPARSWVEVPAYLRWGGWNECPAPEYHVAAWRDWDARYGLELVGMSFDVLNLRVARKPATRDAALELAREQFVYCEDIVFQGVETLSNLAATLMAHDWWYFWWD